MTEPIVGVSWLRERLGDVTVADVRWHLGEPERGNAEYAQGHIPGAVFVDLERDLSAASGPGRHPLPSREEFAVRMSALGIGDDRPVVAYDDRGGAIAARLWWMLRDVGHDSVSVLDGGLRAWVAAGHPITRGVDTLEPAQLTVRPGPTRRIDRDAVRASLGSLTLLDGRAVERYRGDEEPIDPVAGHIPTAINAPTTGNLEPDERFLPAAGLRQRFADLGISPGRDTVVYCGSGVTACHNALALIRAGYAEPILYPGSWSDWSTSGGEVALGAAPGGLSE